MDKRQFLLVVVGGLMVSYGVACAATPTVDVYKSETCGCCGAWVKHMEQNGFVVQVHTVKDPSVYREKLGIPADMASCHTGVVDGYVIEGHVPASEVKRLLKEKPAALGLAVPGRVSGSPGMEGASQNAYDVMLVKKDGKTTVYRHYVEKQ